MESYSLQSRLIAFYEYPAVLTISQIKHESAGYRTFTINVIFGY